MVGRRARAACRQRGQSLMVAVAVVERFVAAVVVIWTVAVVKAEEAVEVNRWRWEAVVVMVTMVMAAVMVMVVGAAVVMAVAAAAEMIRRPHSLRWSTSAHRQQ
jgi:hypothetical protein